MRCRHCKEKFTSTRFNVKYCEKIDCRTQEAMYNLGKIKEREKRLKAKAKRKVKLEVKRDEYAGTLQKEINKLARQIDSKFFDTCIDCGKKLGDSKHGAHFNNVKGHENIRFNLHNIHQSRGHCNKYSSQHKVGYEEGLKNRYGEDYFNFVKFELNLKYPVLKLTGQEISEKLKIVRKLNRDFETFVFTDPKKARDMFNELIGIYK